MIWCVEDDASIRDIEVYALQSTGFEAKGFEDGTSFWEALRTGRPELVVLDVMLPGIDGMELLRRMRADAALSDIPVVMATAKGAEYDKIRGLDLGADYYLTKPFGVMELVSCVKAVLRRCGTKSASQFRCGGLVLDEEFLSRSYCRRRSGCRAAARHRWRTGAASSWRRGPARPALPLRRSG